MTALQMRLRDVHGKLRIFNEKCFAFQQYCLILRVDLTDVSPRHLEISVMLIL